MELNVTLNDTTIYRKTSLDGMMSCCPENPYWGVSFRTPQIIGEWNKSDDYSSDVYSLSIIAVTYLEFGISEQGQYWSFSFAILGFGIRIYRQVTY